MQVPAGLGIIGCGNILGEYLQTLLGRSEVRIVALADLDVARARSAGEPHGIPGTTPAELLRLPEVDIVINLTVPAAHSSVSRLALQAGKHVYSEKPLALTREDGLALLELASAQNLQLACGPDTFMGASFTRALELVQDGAIGRVTFASANFFGHGPEEWHPNPKFFYQPGAGPLFDMGPYYLTQLVKLFGPITQVSGSAVIGEAERVPRRGPSRGVPIPVSTPSTVNALLEFQAGQVATFSCSFDVWASSRPYLELHGTEGTLQLADPNVFEGTLRLFDSTRRQWQDVPTSEAAGQGRGSGVLDLAHAILQGTESEADARHAFHVLDVMHCILESADAGYRLEPLPVA